MGQVLFVFWREVFEALLVVSIIHHYIKCHPDSRRGIKFLFWGVFSGIVLSILLALQIYWISSVLDDLTKSLFMIFMEIFASILIVQMVYWMNQDVFLLKSVIESNIRSGVKNNNWWGVTLVLIIAIVREGSEIIVFLSGFIMSLSVDNASSFFMEMAGGIIMSIFTFYVLSLTNSFMPLRVYLKVTGVILLFFALSMLLKGAEDIFSLLILYFDIPDFLVFPLWDSSSLIDDSGIIGRIFSSFLAYRSQPIVISVVIFVFYWILIFKLFFSKGKHA
ncbi:FTR1 family iron permease [Candidatus Liberibacter americanus]|uniref:High-affinity Fe2+/Pb2+ permease n=1 Tax=Candidatus Liberibacter americanus str. Sao Paulo TaxID=1261131 RepID=U6B4P4_9HYPH|nr:FTR1 family protein [Candidatus Liberibacter americanus]AHA27865.1 High-affinity Fe2+/Pb2+ permease [Candidatus Liberibacter americanus str. Sao Paulo]EMS35908.1 hypothetical protein G653_04271 [Candidatus Liberibacter americanus PW_SP]